MQVSQNVVYVLVFLIEFIRDSYVKGKFCTKEYPVVHICKDNVIEEQTSVYIDTENVPLYQKTFCECIISHPEIKGGVNFLFSYKDDVVPENMVFKMNDLTLNSVTHAYTIMAAEQNLTLRTSENYTKEGICLNVTIDKNASFLIVCKRNAMTTTSISPSTLKQTTADSMVQTDTGDINIVNSPSTLKAPQTSTRPDLTTSESMTQTDTDDNNIIIPVVAAISGLFCLVIVVLLFIFCKRKSAKRKEQAQTPSAAEAREEDNDYYMTENPMYVKSDTDQNIESSEYQYHYIEHHENINHYDSAPESSLEKQSPNVQAQERHYDYSTCLPKSQRGRLALRNIGANTTSDKDTVLHSNKTNTDENIYDKTSTSLTKQFQGIDEYHHISLAGLRKKPVVETSTYHTLGNTRNMHNTETEG